MYFTLQSQNFFINNVVSTKVYNLSDGRPRLIVPFSSEERERNRKSDFFPFYSSLL